jgi:hypothetical protein
MRKSLSALFTVDTIFLMALAATSLVFLVQAYGLNPLAGNLPKIVSWIMLALIAFLLFGKLRDYKKASQAPVQAEESEADPAATGTAPAHTLPWFVTFVLVGLYPVTLVIIGFPAGTVVFLTGVSLILGLKPLHALLFGVFGTIALWFLFVYTFQVPMPDGIILETIRGY